ncbi:MAG: DUF202 domain-containing protein [Euryarchaeota archaeon]|nr:DUF202 domain-containing protein [Euryarchaeota archaeon]MDE1835273.1 DUF202 domain-containing protein [Euryarchaeota archaeon]MDE1881050.1 DUF202 domain-containing protein [Euryarchaeota archaeon]MDE2043569.1 DUF202 domain-containing protein [Thermoplasmata archaeon]
MPDTSTDHLANERTFLAWIRTSITIIGLGFVVARFGLFLRALRTGSAGTASPVSEWVGVALVLSGSLLMAVAWYRFRVVREDLVRGSYTPRGGLELILTVVLVSVGIALAIYLLVS